MRRIVGIASLLIVVGLVIFNSRPQTFVAAANATQPPKKLIEYGWDVPSPSFVAANIHTMEQRPFDGIVVKMSAGPYIFTHMPFADAKFTQDQQDLSSTVFSRFTDNFVIVWASSEKGWNFLSDSDWATAEQNIRNFARTAAAGRFKGILFDTEPYGQNTWAYDTTLYPHTTFEQVQTIVRQRGARFMTILQSELPTVKVIFTWLLGKLRADYDGTGGKIVNGPTPLLSAFVEGMISASTDSTRLIDGNEDSYNYTDATAFGQSRGHLLDSISVLGAEYRAAARTHILTAQAIYTDQILNLTNSPRSSSFYVADQQDRLLLMEHNVYYALQTSDEYVWFYSEKVDWWKTANVPAGVEDAVREAVTAQASGQPLNIDMSFMNAANKALSQAIDIYGHVTIKGGSSISHFVMQSGFYNSSGVESACYADQNGTFDCKLPKGWSGTLTPSGDGYRFDPVSLDFKNVQQNTSVNFTAIRNS